MDNRFSVEEISDAMVPYVLPSSPEEMFWNQLILFFETNNVNEYRITIRHRDGIRILNYDIPKQSEISQELLFDQIHELLFSNSYLKKSIVLAPSINSLLDGSITVDIALDIKADDNLCQKIINKFFDKNRVEGYEITTKLHSSEITTYTIIIPEQAGINQNILLKDIDDLLENNALLNQIKVTDPSATIFDDGSIMFSLVIDANAVPEEDEDEY